MTMIIDGSGGVTFPDASVQPTAGGMTLLGTLNTTSGATQTLSGLNLTGYKQLVCIFNGVSGAATGTITLNSATISSSFGTAGNQFVWGIATIDLTTGICLSIAPSAAALSFSASSYFLTASGLNNASTSIAFGAGGTSFDAGSIAVYGVK